jgi:glycyl-tRNA synthetase beta chain
MNQDLLFEIGVEELPSSFVAGALAALPGLLQKKLSELRLPCAEIRVYGTPRRLAVLARGVAERQADLEEELTGPPVGAAFDKEGKPTRAAEAFAAKLGCTVADLRTVETPKGKYLAGTRRETGKPALELLAAVLPQIIKEIPFRKSMRWGAGDATFGRPIQWLVALFGNRLVEFTFAGISTGRASRGHRFLSPGAVELGGAGDYVARLRAAHVVVDPEERAALMRERLLAAAKEAGGSLIEDEFLVGENLSLVEEPHVIVGTFDLSYLSLPETVILEVMRGHQRDFGARGKDGRLLARYLAIVNTAENPDNIRRGNNGVMRARLADARFFYDEDCKVPLVARREKLAGIVFQNKLGHMLAKSERVEQLARELGQELGFSSEVVQVAARGAHLAKADLVSLMVGEFPDLQGTMGREYACVQGEPEAVADVIRDHYAPRGAKDPTAASDPAALVALADRFDTLVGCFAIGLSPTGAADPFALRRAALGILRTVLSRGYDLSLSKAIEKAYAGFTGVKLDLAVSDLSQKLAEFFRERLRGLLAGELPGDVVDACLAPGSDRPTDVQARAVALAALEPAVRARAGIVFKRATNIVKEAPAGDSSGPRDPGQDAPPAETALFASLAKLDADLASARERRDWSKAFAAIAAFAPDLHEFFEKVMVIVNDDRVRNNRLAMMRSISEKCATIAHFQLLSSVVPASGAAQVSGSLET